jgi:putative phosphoribosyl transferase
MIFRDRKEAGERLAAALEGLKLERPVILGIPRGGVPVAAEVARALRGDLAAVVARKLGAPGNPELAIGATTADGAYYLDEEVARAVRATPQYVAEERARQEVEAARREDLFDSHRRPDVTDRDVVIVDDGIATGSTAIAAVRSLKASGARRAILAVPVGPPSTVARLRREADEVVCLHEDPDFWAVGFYYRDFRAVEDAEVKRVLDAFSAVPVGDPQVRVVVNRGSVRLVGRLSAPDGPGPFPLVIFVHGLGSSKDSPRNVAIAAHLVDAGIATLLFDLSGHGESSRDERGVDAYIDDVNAVLEWAGTQDDIDGANIGVAGSRPGGGGCRQGLYGWQRPPGNHGLEGTARGAGRSRLPPHTGPRSHRFARSASGGCADRGVRVSVGHRLGRRGCKSPLRGARDSGAGAPGNRRLVPVATSRDRLCECGAPAVEG